MFKTVMAGIAGAVIGIAVLTGTALAVDPTGPDALAEFHGGEYSVDETSMLQSDFPCNEDQVLGYHPAFGTEHVGCMHIESVR